MVKNPSKSFFIVRGCFKKGWVTEDLYSLVKEYREWWLIWTIKFLAGTENYDAPLHQIRCLLSDALRDGGCHIEAVHKFLFENTIDFADEINHQFRYHYNRK